MRLARCQDPQDLATLRVTHTLPADLNAFLYAMERDLAAFAEVRRLLLPWPVHCILVLRDRFAAVPYTLVISARAWEVRLRS